MDCAYYRGSVKREERQLLVRLLRRHEAKTMMESWVKLGKTKVPGRTKENPGKAKACEVLKCKGFCLKEYVSVCALDVGCAFHVEKE